MAKKYDGLVFIGRFGPFHKAHEEVIKRARKMAKKTIVMVGSSFQPRNIRNPFTFQERKEMIKAVFPEDDVVVVPLSDYPYNDDKWISAVQSLAYSNIDYTPDPIRIGLIGHEKDHTSYYLKMFPRWGNEGVPNIDGINATDIRHAMLEGDLLPAYLNMSMNAYNELKKILGSKRDDFDDLMDEYTIIEKYKEAWAAAPYPPTFVTVDAVVVQSGHILLVKRKDSPGKGQWALPGGFLNQNETLVDAMVRELKEETKLKMPERTLKRLVTKHKTFDAPHRSTRGRTLTTAYLVHLGMSEELPKVVGSDDAEKAMWVPLNEVRQEDMFEDHFHIIDYFLSIG